VNLSRFVFTNIQILEFAEYARFVLKMRGYREVENYSDADMLITFSYGISDPQVREYTVNVPESGTIKELILFRINTKSN
jgi:hypothetical protein